MIRINPLFNNVLILRDEAQEKTPGGILLPDAAKEKPKAGTVVAAGPGRTLDSGVLLANALEVGDRVLFKAYSGTEVELGDARYTMMMDHEILCTVNDDGQ